MLALNKIWNIKELVGLGRGSADGIPYYFSMEVELLLTGVL